MMDKSKKEDCVSQLQSCSVLSFRFLGPWRWDRQFAPKCRYRITSQYCIVSQNRGDLT